MKKIIYILILLIFPFNVFAYSEYIIPGGETLGIEINSDGVLIVGYYKVNGDEINQDLHIGDRITYINNEKVNSVDNMVDLIDKYMKDESVDIKYIRDNIEYDGKLELSYFNGTYRTGLYVKATLYDYTFEKQEISNKEVEEKYKDYSNEQLYEMLLKIDPKSCETIHQNNRRRVLRAIAIYETSGKSKSETIDNQKHEMLYDAIIICLTLNLSLW